MAVKKVEKTFCLLKKTVNLRKFSKEPGQISKPRYMKSIPLVNKRNREGVPFLWRYKKGQGVGPLGGASAYRLC